jgi:outer membrane protein assembly factor BamD
MLNGFEKHPDVAKASRVGDPTMIDPEPETAMGVVRDLTKAGLGAGRDNKLTAQPINGKIAPNEPAPRSDTATVADPSVPAPGEQPAPQGPAAAELTPNAADPNELKPNVAPDPTALPPLQQNNELDMSGGTPSSASASTSTSSKNTEMADISSSKKKKKKGIAKLNPF